MQAALGDAFRVEREIHGGGMSRLFLATEVSLNRLVVVKLLPPEFTSEVSAARFKQEMEIAARLQHPHILPVLTAAAPEGLLYYVTPYVAGESLRGRMEREGALPVPDAVRLLAEVADALAFAHGQGVIHRDIKPENILLEGRHAVLADFGIARALMESRTGDRLTATGLSVGTPGYMSPEQIAGSRDIDSRSDVYSLAVVAYEMLSGRAPFGGTTPQAVLAANLSENPSPLHELRAEVPVGLSALLGRALSKDPSDRFANAAEFSEALSAVPGRTATGAEASQPPPARWPVRRMVTGAVLLGLAALILVLFSRSQARTRALLDAALPAAERGEFDAVARMLEENRTSLGARGLAPLVRRTAGHLAVTSEPPGARVFLTRVTPLEEFAGRAAVAFGATPVSLRPMVAGEYLAHVIWPSGDSLTLLAAVGVGDTARLTVLHPPPDNRGRGFVHVPSGPSVAGPVSADFLISRTEVTHAEFERFVDDGGYRNLAFWPESLRIGDRVLDRDAALATFVDGSGLPGPRTWTGGRAPAGQADHPVTGVSWYEAAAYARWAEAALPTAAEWWRAALGDGAHPFPWGDDGVNMEVRANFSFGGSSPAGAHPLGVSPFGALDMAGNAREWLEDTAPGSDRHPAVGGGWRDATYMFDRSLAEHHDPWIAHELIGFRLAKRTTP